MLEPEEDREEMKAARSISGTMRSAKPRPLAPEEATDRSETGGQAIADAIASALTSGAVAQPPAGNRDPKGIEGPSDEGAGLPSRGGGVLIGALLVLLVASLAALVVAVPPPNVLRRFALASTEAAASAEAKPRTAAQTISLSASTPTGTLAAEITPADFELEEPPAVPASAPGFGDPSKGTMTLPATAEGHRVYVDGRLISSPPSRLVVASCGRHVVRVGARGRDQAIIVPCQGNVLLTYP